MQCLNQSVVVLGYIAHAKITGNTSIHFHFFKLNAGITSSQFQKFAQQFFSSFIDFVIFFQFSHQVSTVNSIGIANGDRWKDQMILMRNRKISDDIELGIFNDNRKG